MTLYDQLKNYVEENLSAPKSHIYHYTKPESAKKIIENKVLWMTPHDELNRKNNREFKIGPEIIKNKLKNTSIKQYTTLFDEKCKYFKLFKGYIASFCEENNYEHARKEYGTFCLGFKDTYLEKFKSPKTDIILGHVIYNRKEQERIISEMIELHENYTNAYSRKLKDLLPWLFMVITFLKEERDHRDNECRIIATHVMDVDDPKEVVGKHCVTEITFTDSDIILPYS